MQHSFDVDEINVQPRKLKSSRNASPLRNHGEMNYDAMRGSNYFNNHTLPYPLVNRQMDHSNVRNNPKVWQKRLEEELIPQPLYENYGLDNNDRRNMEIMTREEYSDLQHFPRTRRKYFDYTMQPNRYIFTNERSQVRDAMLMNDRNTLDWGGKSGTYHMDKPRAESLDVARNTLNRRPQEWEEQGDNEVMYQKRVGNDRMPPYNDLDCFTRTKQHYFQPDVIRERAQGAIRQDANKKNSVWPREKDYPMPKNHKDGFLKEQQDRQERMKEKLKAKQKKENIRQQKKAALMNAPHKDDIQIQNADNEINTPHKPANNNNYPTNEGGNTPRKNFK